jgi:hypothetical protein
MPRYVDLTEAASNLARANRVLVIGYSGGGKTTLSQNLAATFGLEFQSLDRDVRWLPGWKERDRHRRVALLGLARRVARFYGSVRPAMAPGCPERLPDREFLSYIWNFERKYAPIFIECIDRHGPDVPVAVLRSHREMARLLRMSSEFEFGPMKADHLEGTIWWRRL